MIDLLTFLTARGVGIPDVDPRIASHSKILEATKNRGGPAAPSSGEEDEVPSQKRTLVIERKAEMASEPVIEALQNKSSNKNNND
jgi:hypothetical protein